jgi:hypothetical protein
MHFRVPEGNVEAQGEEKSVRACARNGVSSA